jgi:hypothetical protein
MSALVRIADSSRTSRELRKVLPNSDIPGSLIRAIFRRCRTTGTFAVEVFEGILYLKMSPGGLWPAPAWAMRSKTRQSGFWCSRQPTDQVCNWEENPMNKRFIATFVCSALSLIGASGFAFAETIGRYECSIIGTASQDPIGDPNGHVLVSVQYSCFGVNGLLKGDVHTASSISEWDGPKGTFLLGGGIHRAPSGLAVTQITEGTGSVVMKDGKPAGTDSSGKGVFKFASGTLAALSGKVFKFSSKPTGVLRFDLEFTD